MWLIGINPYTGMVRRIWGVNVKRQPIPRACCVWISVLSERLRSIMHCRTTKDSTLACVQSKYLRLSVLFLTSLCITFQLARPMLSQRVERSSDRVSFKFLSQNTHRCNATRERSMHMWNLSFKTVLKQELLRFQATGRSQNT